MNTKRLFEELRPQNTVIKDQNQILITFKEQESIATSTLDNKGYEEEFYSLITKTKISMGYEAIFNTLVSFIRKKLRDVTNLKQLKEILSALILPKYLNQFSISNATGDWYSLPASYVQTKNKTVFVITMADQVRKAALTMGRLPESKSKTGNNSCYCNSKTYKKGEIIYFTEGASFFSRLIILSLLHKECISQNDSVMVRKIKSAMDKSLKPYMYGGKIIYIGTGKYIKDLTDNFASHRDDLANFALCEDVLAMNLEFEEFRTYYGSVDSFTAMEEMVFSSGSYKYFVDLCKEKVVHKKIYGGK